MNLSIKEVAALFGVECADQTMISSVEFDSRLVTTDSLFVPLAGTRDGHEFAQQAQEKEQSLLLEPSDNPPPEGLLIIEVSDTLAAFQKAGKIL